MTFTKNIIIASTIVFTLASCGNSVKSSEELNKLTQQEFFTEVCHAFVDANVEQLEVIPGAEHLVKIVRRHIDQGVADKAAEKIDCTQPTYAEKISKKTNKTQNAVKYAGGLDLVLKSYKENGIYSLAR